MDKIARLRQEIERRLQRENEILWNARKRGTYPSPSCEYNLLTLTSLRDFLDTLSEEPSKSLEEEISRTYRDGSVTDTEDIDHVAYENIAHHFAEWGAEHLRDSTKMIDESLDEAAGRYEAYYDVGEEHGYLYCLAGDIKNAFIAGARWQTEHLKK